MHKRSTTHNNIRQKVIIFDGICNLCNSAINILIKLDKTKKFQYTSLQGAFVKTLNTTPNIDSIIFYDEGILYYKSTAILKILNALGGIWSFFNVFYIIPTFIRDYIYDAVAKYRYTIFGKLKHCRIPNQDEEALFLD